MRPRFDGVLEPMRIEQVLAGIGERHGAFIAVERHEVDQPFITEVFDVELAGIRGPSRGCP